MYRTRIYSLRRFFSFLFTTVYLLPAFSIVGVSLIRTNAISISLRVSASRGPSLAEYPQSTSSFFNAYRLARRIEDIVSHRVRRRQSIATLPHTQLGYPTYLIVGYSKESKQTLISVQHLGTRRVISPSAHWAKRPIYVVVNVSLYLDLLVISDVFFLTRLYPPVRLRLPQW